MAGHDGWKDQPRVPKGSSEGGQFTSKDKRILDSAIEASGYVPEGWESGQGDEELYERFLKGQSRLTSERHDFLTSYTVEELKNKNKRVFLDKEGETGFIIDNGDLQNLFSTNQKGKEAIKIAISMGAKTLDCFDGYLPGFYAKFGFREWKREPNWTPGGKDVVYMRIED